MSLAACLMVAVTSTSTVRADDAAVPPPPPKHLAFDLVGGAAYQSFMGIPIYGADFGIAFGPDNGAGADLFAIGGFYGRTENGLTVGEFRVGYTPEWRLTSWARLELGLQLVYFNVESIAGVDNQWGFGPGVRPALKLDFAPLGYGHAYLAIGGEMDAVSGTLMPSCFADVGVRF